ncbi:hypothetical protein [Hymenobacter sp. YC55]|uniref:hypothetical protein n=1 Tax=Hymenobacter sp. YC55 TaxID=3034019 RepID=UPI0023F7A7FA|nr:hypothetical protein [Hymenobacter sp. YC55]MDF7815906.1 hypothetical protein [Hymenobacter sp. YC55]
MTRILALFLFLNGYQATPALPRETVQAVVNEVINCEELTGFTAFYTNRKDRMYFRFTPSPTYNKQTLRALRSVVLTFNQSAPLVYDEEQDEKRKPVLTIQLVHLTRDSAQVRLGFPIEGVVGQFTLVHRGTWRLVKRDVYEI